MIFNPLNISNYLRIAVITLGIITMASTCEEPIDLDIGDPVQLVAICEFAPNQPFSVIVSESRSVLNTSDDVIYRKDAKVIVQDDAMDNIELRLEDNIANAIPFYISEQFASINESYEISVEVENLPALSGSSSIPDLIQVDGKIEAIQIEEEDNSIKNYTATLSFEWQDDPNADNYYHINIYRPITFFWVLDGDTLINVVDPIGAEQISQSLNAEAPYQINFNGGILVSDDASQGQLINTEVKLQFQLDGSEELFEQVYIELRHVSKAYYDFHLAVSQQQQVTRTTPLTEPIIIPSNIEGGLGLFAGYNPYRDTLIRK